VWSLVKLGLFPKNTSSNLVFGKMLLHNKVQFKGVINQVLYSLTKQVEASNIIIILHRFKTFLPVNLPRANKKYLLDLMDSHLVHYPSPITLTYA
jgi:hypothetical protein